MAVSTAVNRRADAVWHGTLIEGSGTVSASSSGAFADLPVSWSSRTEESNGRTSPEELVAAAHAACFSMAFSSRLAKAGHPADELRVSATVTFEKLEAGWHVASSALTVRGRVPGMDDASFSREAEAAKDGCPISVALHGNVALSVEASLDA
jgi:osmotically inducible protein OsmC